MVVLDPKVSSRRLWWERLIWVLDMASYLFLAVAGYAAAFDPSDYVVSALEGYQWVIWLWGGLLLFGLFGFVGRVTRIWAIEYPANVFTAWGAVLYLLILLPSILDGASVALPAVIFVAWAYLCRRYAELNIYTNDPRVKTWRMRLEAALARRTENTVPRLRD